MSSPTETSAWQSKRSFEETNWHMLQDDTLCDVTFMVGNDKKEEIKAHRFILASRSPVFYAMFCGSLAESSDTIQVPDIEPEIFRALLRFIYTEDCTIGEDNVMSLLYSAKKYETMRLAEKCKEYLYTQLSIENACVILQHAHKFDESELEEKCFGFVLDNGEEVMKSDGFTTLSKKVLQKLIESDRLNGDELNVYNACKRWAVQQCKQKCKKQEYSETELRVELEELVYWIRFPTMSFETFAKCVAIEDILTPEEKVAVFQSIAEVDTKRPVHNFCSNTRKRVRKQQLKLSRFNTNESLTNGWSHGGSPDAINFKVSDKARILGVSLFSPVSAGALQGEVSLKMGSSTLASRCDVRIEYEKSKYDEDVFFVKPYTVEPGTEYTIYTLLKGSSTCYGQGANHNITTDAFDVSFVTSDQSTNGTNVEMGQINSLILEVSTTY